jgi:putative zinc finger protein
MTDHRRFLDLVAISIDFDLSPSERAELDAHVAGCADCRQAAGSYRSDALALVAMPALQLAPDRSAVILERIVGRRRAQAPRIRMLLVAALLALLATSVALTVGAELLRRAREQQQLTVVPERPVVDSPLDASPLPSTSLAPTEAYSAEAGGTLPDNHSAPTSVAVGPGGEVVVVGGNGCVVGSDTPPSCVARISEGASIDDPTLVSVDAGAAADLGRAVPVSGPQLGIDRVAASDDGFVAIGYADDGGFGVTTWRKEPGKPWERLPRDHVFKDARVRTVAAIGGGWIIGGEIFGPSAPRAAVWTSADGRKWHRADDGPVFDIGGYLQTGEEPAAGGISDIASADGTTVLVGSTRDSRGDASMAAAWVSDDGLTWRPSTLPALDGRIDVVARLGTGFIAFVTDGRQETDDAILVSDDGERWRQVTTEGLPMGFDAAAASPVGTGVAVAVTRDERMQILGSPDGVHWTALQDIAFQETPGVTPPQGSVLISAVDMAEAPDGRAIIAGWVDMGSNGPSKSFVYRVSATPQ